jgi:Carboxypeptidase regulatory-like domain
MYRGSQSEVLWWQRQSLVSSDPVGRVVQAKAPPCVQSKSRKNEEPLLQFVAGGGRSTKFQEELPMWRFIRSGAIVAALMVSAVSFAQNTNSGDIRGTVTDVTGAVIPGVTVTVTDVDKGVTKTFTSDSAGLYDTGSIVPDHYLLTFTKEGFSTFVRGPITLRVEITTIDAKLAIGKTTQKVVVTADVALLQTESGEQSDTLTSQTMSQLPQTGTADWENFIWLQPGAAGAPENASTANTPGLAAVSIDGNLPYESVLQDGATTTLPASQNSNVTIFETTAEVKISASAFSAQYGVGDITYNQITKGGTEQFHGTGYEYFQNNALNAAPYSFGQKASVPFLRYNNYGFNISGPVIPHKMYFFFDWDKTSDNGGASNGFETIPTPAVLSGDFTAPGLPTLYDPTTQTIQQTGTYTYNGPQYPNGSLTVKCPCTIRQTFISEYGSNKIPANLLSPVAQKIQAYYPQANTTGQIRTGIDTNNFFYNVPNINTLNKYFGRLDWDITPRNRLTLSDTQSDNPEFFSNQGICPINCQAGDIDNNNAQASDVWSFSSTFTNEARFGYTDQLNYYIPSTLNQGFPAKLGLQFAEADNFPNVGISNYYGLGSAINGTIKEFVFDPSDVVTLIRGRHVLHFGGEFLINRADSTAWGNINAGSVNYNGDYTAAGGAATVAYDGQPYADFLLGQTNSWNAGVTPEYGARWKTPQAFIQDDWKLRPNLTVNLGLRWEGETGWSEVHGNEAAFDPTVVNPVDNSLGAIWYGFSHANGRSTLQKPTYHIFLPRVGFSWQAMPNTVVRGGFGVYASTWSQDTYGGGLGGALGSSGSYGDTTNGICPVVQLDSNGASPDTADPGCGTGSYNGTSLQSHYLTAPTTPNAFNGQSVTYNQYHTPVPTNYQWTLAVQRQFAQNYMAEVAYVGNHGKNLNFPVDINQVPEALLGPNDLSSEPYPLFQGINGSTNNAVSNYNSLQAQAAKRMNDGLQFSVNYTWSHFLDDQDSSGWGSHGGYQNYQNAFDTGANYSNSNFDIRNMFKGQAIYLLPFGKGREFFNRNWLVDEAVGGWQASLTWVYQSGNPIGITTGNNNSSNNQSGGYTQFANLVGDWHLKGSTKQRLNEWYNLSALAVPAPYTYGDFRRNVVTGPDLSEVNFSLGKTFALWAPHHVNLEIRGDAVNVLNHPSFGQPGNNAIGNGESAQITGVTVGGRTMELYGRLSF